MTFRLYRCVFSLYLSTPEAVILLVAISVLLGLTCPWQGESGLCLSMTKPGFTVFWACFLVDLLALLKWKAFPDRIMDILGRLRHVSGEEIVKVWLHTIHTCYLSKNLGRRPHFPLISASKPLRPFLEVYN